MDSVVFARGRRTPRTRGGDELVTPKAGCPIRTVLSAFLDESSTNGLEEMPRGRALEALGRTTPGLGRLHRPHNAPDRP